MHQYPRKFSEKLPFHNSATIKAKHLVIFYLTGKEKFFVSCETEEIIPPIGINSYVNQAINISCLSRLLAICLR